MIRKPIKRESLLEEFRADRGQKTEVPKLNTTPPNRKRRENTPYDSFLRKYADIENTIDGFTTRDLVYYFREIAQEQGFKYVVANIKKDMAIMKRLKEDYGIREICCMIEFLFESEQDYLDKDRLSPNILASRWINTIYADMLLWVDDKYVPKSVIQAESRKKSQKEWDSSVDTQIGVQL